MSEMKKHVYERKLESNLVGIMKNTAKTVFVSPFGNEYR